MTETRWRSGRDVAVMALMLAVLHTAQAALPLHMPDSSGALVAYNVAFGPLVLLLTTVVYARLWWLIRIDGGPAVLVAWALAAALFDVAYSSAWPLFIFNSGVAPVLDLVAFGVRVVGLLLLATGLMLWTRLPRWVGAAFATYAALLLLRFAAERVGLGVSLQLQLIFWIAALIALAVGLLMTRPEPREVSPRSSTPD